MKPKRTERRTAKQGEQGGVKARRRCPVCAEPRQGRGTSPAHIGQDAGRLMLVSEVAKCLRISDEHCRRLMRRGIIKGYREGRRGGWRIEESEIERYQLEKRYERRR